ncbi:hypothetical protein U0035_22460 [Niabella yanshanensis]|uniref:Circularly permuted type 2 ATP-grasp protein n=1 Tax=Niabella yanshanensis TaxID=577386 RepID=A0ABZ0W8Q8_9BACT|nr:hypothetical protein [Niabella yanshanensis]WQD38441.1 hypothetical protein U0035_22460 [Niabella yanshanensis]
MVPDLRAQYNSNFTTEKYEAFLKELNSKHGTIQFRSAETPVFVPRDFTNQLLSACESIVDVILKPDFKALTQNAIPRELQVLNEDDYPSCITFDFGVCINDQQKLEPQLIEMQAFPTLFAFEVLLDDVFYKHFSAPSHYSSYLNGLDRDSYLKLLKDLLLNGHEPEHVVLLEIFPHQQKTNIDFYCTQEYTGIIPLCVTELIQKGKQLFYLKEGKETRIKRIYNRVIFDELLQQEDWVQEKAKVLFEDLEVEWMPHPNWFYRISKYTLPLIQHPNIPSTQYLDQVEHIPEDLQNYVLKPLFSFAGQGVVIDITPDDIQNIEDPQNWILQKKVTYASVIQTPDEPAKAEIRVFYFWPKNAARPVPANNLVRLSKGKMIGVRYNKDKTWTGGTFGLFER